MNDNQIVIIGGGLQGLSTANALLDKGENVLLLEKESEIAAAASFANAGMLTPSQSMPWNSPSDIFEILAGVGRKNSPMTLSPENLPSLFFWGLKFLRNSTNTKYIQISKNCYELANYSKELTKEIREKESFSYDEAATGTMKIFRSMEKLEKSAELSKQILPSEHLKILDPKGVVLQEPQLESVSTELAGGIFYENDEIGDANKFCKHLEQLVRAKGGRILNNTTIKKLLIDKGSVNGVITDRAILQTKRVVVTAGSWSYLLLKNIGLKLPVRPVKGYSLTMSMAGLEAKPTTAIVDEAVHTAITPLGDRIRVAGTAEFTGFNDEIHPRRIEYLNNTLRTVYPDLYSQLDPDESQIWYGFRPMSADGLPFIGESKVRGLYVNTGQGHLGWTLAMGSSALLADLITNKETDIDATPYLAKRSL
jgi:D-amino-acid dehydrogenase